MTTPTIRSLGPLLERLFDEAEAANGATLAAVADLSDADRARLMQSKTDYRDLYGRLKDAPLAVSRETARLLYMLARASRAKVRESSKPIEPTPAYTGTRLRFTER